MSHLTIEFIADIAANHDSKIDRAYKLIELAKKSGADTVKFQFFKAKTLINKKAFKQLGSISHQSRWDDTVYNTYKKYETPYNWIPKLFKKCQEVDIEFMGTPYDFEAVDKLDPYVSKFKIGSGDIDYYEFLKYIADKGKPIYLSTGASDGIDISNAARILNKNKLSIFHCNCNYTIAEDNYNYLNLNAIRDYPNIIGLSDHNKEQYIINIAVALGARKIERHFTDGNSDSPDNDFALIPFEWKKMVAAGYRALASLGDGWKKIEENEKETRIIQRRDKRTGLRPDIEYYDNVKKNLKTTNIIGAI